MEFQTVFGPEIKGPSKYYRIPSLITAKDGVLIACADARYCSGMDNPNRIDKVIRRRASGARLALYWLSSATASPDVRQVPIRRPLTQAAQGFERRPCSL